MKESACKDSEDTAQFDVIRLFCSIATILQFRLGFLDIQGAYIQSGPIQRDIYVSPPPECGAPRGSIWKLVKQPYVITEVGRQWAKVFENCLIKEENFESVFGVPKLFVKRGVDKKSS